MIDLRLEIIPDGGADDWTDGGTDDWTDGGTDDWTDGDRGELGPGHTEWSDEPEPAGSIRRRTLRESLGLAADSVLFVLGTLSAGWLAYLAVSEPFTRGWQQLWFLVVFWLVVAYLLLPRVHSILTLFYVPDYFIGRAKTREGLLGDPINLAVRGREEQVHEAMARAGWHLADELGLRSTLKTMWCTVLRRSYPDAPVSPLHLFGGIQAFTYQQEVEGNPSKRHHVRFWRCPPGWLLPGGHRADWLAAGSYDRSIGLSFFTLQFTHRIDKEIDRERDHIVGGLVEANDRARVELIRNFSTGYHHVNGGGDAIVTDGDLPIVDLARLSTWVAVEGRPVVAGSDARRPVSIHVGVLLMALRIVAAVIGGVGVVLPLSLVGLSLVGPALGGAGGAGAGVASPGIAGPVLAVTSGCALLGFYAVLGLLIYRGHNWARFTALALTGASVLTAAVAYAAGGPQITLETNFVGLALDILVLVALSTTEARRFSHARALVRRSARTRTRPRAEAVAT
jgi:hypothetical protein